jgi:hypothetical protein
MVITKKILCVYTYVYADMDVGPDQPKKIGPKTDRTGGSHGPDQENFFATRVEQTFNPQHPGTGVIGMDTLHTRYALWEQKHADLSVKIQPLGEKLTELMEKAVPGTLASPHSSVILQPTDAAACAPVFCCAAVRCVSQQIQQQQSVAGEGHSGAIINTQPTAAESGEPLSFKWEKESYRIDELGAKLALEKKVVDWMKAKQVDPDDPLLVLSYQPSFPYVGAQDFFINKQEIANRLVSFIFDE